MAREQIDKATVRNRLAPRREPYWGAPVERGLHVGFRKLTHGGNWIARWRDEDGNRLHFSIGPVTESTDYDAAKRAAKAWQRNADAGVEVGEVRTVSDACQMYVKDRAKAKGKATAHDAELRFKRTVYEHQLGSIALAKISQKKIEEWRDGLAAADADGKTLSKASLNRTLTALKAALNMAVRFRHVGAERAIEWALVKPYDAGNRRSLFLDLAQRRKLIGAAAGNVRHLMEAVALTGARAGELTSARRSQFDKRTNSMTFQGKTGVRMVPLSQSAVVFFDGLAGDKAGSDHLFTRDDGKPWAPSDWDKLVRTAAANADLPTGVCLYTLRHSFITSAIQGGLTALEVARLTGTSLQMIDKHYGHMAASAAQERLSLIELL